MAKTGALKFFVVWRGGGQIFLRKIIFAFGPPLQVFVNGPLKPRDYENTGNPESF